MSESSIKAETNEKTKNNIPPIIKGLNFIDKPDIKVPIPAKNSVNIIGLIF